MRDMRPQLTPPAEGALASLVIFTGALFVERQFYWWSVPLALAFGVAVAFVAGREEVRRRGKDTPEQR